MSNLEEGPKGLKMETIGNRESKPCAKQSSYRYSSILTATTKEGKDKTLSLVAAATKL